MKTTTIVGLGIIGAGLYLFLKKKGTGAPAPGGLQNQGNAPTPNIWGQLMNVLGRPTGTVAQKSDSNNQAWAQLGVAGINALGGIYRDYQNRKGVPAIGGDTVGGKKTIVVPASSPTSGVDDVGGNYGSNVDSIDIDNIGDGTAWV